MAWTRLTHPEYFMLAITRASEICIGIVAAGLVLAGSDLGGAARRLAALFANLSADGAIACVTVGRFSGIFILISSR
jgi:hypothetical protein